MKRGLDQSTKKRLLCASPRCGFGLTGRTPGGVFAVHTLQLAIRGNCRPVTPTNEVEIGHVSGTNTNVTDDRDLASLFTIGFEAWRLAAKRVDCHGRQANQFDTNPSGDSSGFDGAGGAGVIHANVVFTGLTRGAPSHRTSACCHTLTAFAHLTALAVGAARATFLAGSVFADVAFGALVLACIAAVGAGTVFTQKSRTTLAVVLAGFASNSFTLAGIAGLAARTVAIGLAVRGGSDFFTLSTFTDFATFAVNVLFAVRGGRDGFALAGLAGLTARAVAVALAVL